MKDRVIACVTAAATQLAEAEKLGRLPPAVIEELVQIGFFDLVRPKQYGGHEAEFSELLDIIVETASLNGSLAWFMMIMSQHNIVARLLPKAISDTLFACRPMLMASCAFPIGRAEKKGDHYQLSGTWKYATGIHHANWVLVDADVADDRHGKGARFILPPTAFVVHDDWDAFGMRASGSNSVSLDGYRVPATMRVEHRLAHFTGEGAESKVPRRYRIPGRLLTALGTVAPIVGLLKGMARDLSPEQAGGMTLEQVASRSQRVGLTARARFLQDTFFSMVRQVSDATYKPELFTVSYQQDAVMRCAQLAQQCRQLASELFACGGTRAALRSSSIGIRFNDIHVMATHYLMRQAVAEVNAALVLEGG